MSSTNANSIFSNRKIFLVGLLTLPFLLSYAVVYYIPFPGDKPGDSFARACLTFLLAFPFFILQAGIFAATSCKDVRTEWRVFFRFMLPIATVLLASLLISQFNLSIYMKEIPASNNVFYKVNTDVESIGGVGSVGNEWSYLHFVVCGDNTTQFYDGSTIGTKANNAFCIRSRIIEHDDAISDVGENDSNPIIYAKKECVGAHRFVLSNNVRVVEDGGRRNKGAYKDFRVTYNLKRVFPVNESRIALLYMENSDLYPLSVFLTLCFLIVLFDLVYNLAKCYKRTKNADDEKDMQDLRRELSPKSFIVAIIVAALCTFINFSLENYVSDTSNEDSLAISSTAASASKQAAYIRSIDYDETVYVETASKRFHKSFCSVKNRSKEMIVAMTRREAVKNKNNPCSACFHD